MSIAMVTRTVIVAAYLIALFVEGRADTVTGAVAAGVVAVWTVPLLRDSRLRHHALQPGGRSEHGPAH
jgi:Co/Zn/Cd efflux system component